MKLISNIALGLVTSAAISAAPKRAPNKVPTKAPNPAPAVAAAQPEQPPQPAAKAGGGLVVNLAVYGAYNVSSSDLFNQPAGSTATWARTGMDALGGGANFLMGTSFIRAGVNVVYARIGKFQQGGSTVFLTYLPIEALIRIYPIAGLYVGGLGGYAIDLSSAVVSGNGSLTKSNGFTYGGSIGYLISNGAVDMDIGADLRVLSVSATAASGGADFSLTSLDSAGVAAGASKTYTILNIIPRIGFSFKF
jgi:hypothetical protein